MRNSRDNIDELDQIIEGELLESFPEHLDNQGLALISDPSATEEAKLVVPIEWEPFLAPLALDDASYILELLDTKDLQSASVVNKTANRLARTIQLKRYKAALALSQSCLWQYLPLIAQDVPEAQGKAFIDYVEATGNLKFEGQARTECEKLSTCLTFLRNRGQVPSNWNGILVQDTVELQILAQEILGSYPNESPSKPPKNLKEFMNLCASQFQTQMQELTLWRKYHKLDSVLSTFLLFYRMNWIQRFNLLPQNQQNLRDPITYLINPKNSGLLTGFGLMALDSYLPGLFAGVVREAIRLFRKSDKSPQEKQRLVDIEVLLDRITEANLLDYIPSQYFSHVNPSADPNAVFVDLRQRCVVDPKRALMIEVIQANYICLMKKFTAPVLFKIEDTVFKENPPCNEYPLKKSRIIQLILTRPILLNNLGKEGVVKILCILQDTLEVIPKYPLLWPLLSFDVIESWFQIDNMALHQSAKLVLSNAIILKSLINAQILSIVRYLGPQSLADLLDCAAFRARLEEDKVLNGHRENKLLMQLAELNCKDLYAARNIAKNAFTRALLTVHEARTLILDPKFSNNRGYIRNCLLQREDVINTLSSFELLKIVENDHDCSLQVASNYLSHFTVEDLIAFSKSCLIFINSLNKIELNVLFEKLPLELERRADSLTNAQWLIFARMHSQIGNFIVNRYFNKLGDAELLSLSQHYKEDAELPRKITVSLEARAQEKRRREAELLTRQELEKRKAQRQLEDTRAQEQKQKQKQGEDLTESPERQERTVRYVSTSVNKRPQNCQKQHRDKDSYPITSHTRVQERTPWAQYLRLALFATLGLIGFALFMLGIGSLVGIPIVMTITSTLFSFLPWSAALTSVAGGYLVYLVAFVTAAVTSVDKTPEKTATSSKKSCCSTASFFNMFNCWSEASQNKLISQEVSLPELRFRTPSGSVNVRPQPRPQTTVEKDHDNSHPFIYQ